VLSHLHRSLHTTSLLLARIASADGQIQDVFQSPQSARSGDSGHSDDAVRVVCNPSQIEQTIQARAFAVGERVLRRDAGKGWGFGFVTSTTPLKVTVKDDPEAQGFKWDEVKKDSAEEGHRMQKLKEEAEGREPFQQFQRPRNGQDPKQQGSGFPDDGSRSSEWSKGGPRQSPNSSCSPGGNQERPRLREIAVPGQGKQDTPMNKTAEAHLVRHSPSFAELSQNSQNLPPSGP